MNDLIVQFEEYLNARMLSGHTVRNYVSDVRQFWEVSKDLGFDPLKLDRPSAFLYLGWLAKKYAERSTIGRKRESVKHFYKFLREENHVKRNEFDYISYRKADQKFPAFMSQNDAAKLLDSVRPNPALNYTVKLFGRLEISRSGEADFLAIRDRAILETLYGTGTRAQETVSLDWTDVDFRAAFIRVNQGKGRKDRVIPITETAMEALWAYGIAYRTKFDMEPVGNNPLFLSRNKTRITTRSLGRIVKLRLEMAGLDPRLSTHSLRHTMATHLSQNGMDIVAIAACLGHASLSITQKYVHLSLVDVMSSYDRGHPRA